MDLNWKAAIDSIPILNRAALLTVELTLGAVAIGVVIALFMALARLSKTKVLRGLAIGYIDFFGGPLCWSRFIWFIFWYQCFFIGRLCLITMSMRQESWRWV